MGNTSGTIAYSVELESTVGRDCSSGSSCLELIVRKLKGKSSTKAVFCGIVMLPALVLGDSGTIAQSTPLLGAIAF